MQINLKPYPHLIQKNYMSDSDFEKCKSSIDFDEIKSYCDNPSVHEHTNSTHGNYSMPTDLATNAQWLFDYFANQKVYDDVTTALYGKKLQPDHSYINLHWDSADTSLGVHNDQKKYRWLVTGQLYVEGDHKDGVILQDDDLNEITQVPLEPNLFYAMATSMYSWHHVKHIKQTKISILVRFGKKQINTVTKLDKNSSCAIIIHNDGHYDGHYSKLGMRMANMTEAWLANQGYKNIHMSEWRNDNSLEALKKYCNKYYQNVCIVPSGYLGQKDLFAQSIEHSDVETITKDNIKELAEIVFNRSRYKNSRFRAGEIILKSFDQMGTFSNTHEKVL